MLAVAAGVVAVLLPGGIGRGGVASGRGFDPILLALLLLLLMIVTLAALLLMMIELCC